MRYQTIVEGATLVHQADRAARAALYKSLDAYMEKLWRPYNPNGYDEENPHQQHDDYDRFNQFYYKPEHQTALITGVCEEASRALTQVIRDDLDQRFGSSMMFGDQKISTQTMSVEVSPQPTEGEDAHKGGFFSPGMSWSWIKVHIDPDKLTAAAMAAVQTIAFGEGEDRDALVNAIAPTFAHEYSHLLQYLGAKDYRAFKSGITTLKGNNGTHRQGDRSPAGWWRYIGSNAEIDSFASGCASGMIADMSRRSYLSTDPDNDQVDDALRSISFGYGNDEWYNMYLSHYYDALADHYQEIGLSKLEATKVWKRFLKTVYAKLIAYKKTIHGKDASGYYLHQADPKWLDWAKHGIAYCAAHIADEIAKQAADQSYQIYDGSWRIEPYGILDKAEKFIEKYFYKDDYDFNKSIKIGQMLKQLVIRRLPVYQQKAAA